ncbi:MAG TPA: DUF2442 domain-containing protein [Planctomycetota bacterium]
MSDPSNRSSPSSEWWLPEVVEARHLGQYRVWLRFNDGLAGELDLSAEIHGEVFEPLRDPAFFAGFVLDHTLTWRNGADFAPEFLYERLREARRQVG